MLLKLLFLQKKIVLLLNHQLMFKFQFLYHTISPILANQNTFGTGCALVWFGNFDNEVLTEGVARQDNNRARGARRTRGLRRMWGRAHNL